MAVEFLSEFSINSLIWVTSLDDDEMDMTIRIVQELHAYFQSISLEFFYYRIRNIQEFYNLLDHLEERARAGGRPMIHLDMHGNKDGLAIKRGSGCDSDIEFAPWADVVPKLQAINVASRGNLCIVAGVCYALHAIREIHIDQPCAIHILVAPEEEVYVDLLDESTVDFYMELFSTGRIELAHEKHLSKQLKVFYSEKLLIVSLARYVKYCCIGEGGEERKKRLFQEGMRNRADTPENRESVRVSLEAFLQPDQALVQKYADLFLVGRPCPFSIEDVMQLVQGADGP